MFKRLAAAASVSVMALVGIAPAANAVPKSPHPSTHAIDWDAPTKAIDWDAPSKSKISRAIDWD